MALTIHFISSSKRWKCRIYRIVKYREKKNEKNKKQKTKNKQHNTFPLHIYTPILSENIRLLIM